MDEATLAEVRALRKQVVELQDQLTSKKVETQKTPCKGTTGRGLPCRKNAVDGTEYCNMHGKPQKHVTKKMKKTAEPKAKKILAEHCHALCQEMFGTCKLCQVHGNVLDDKLTDEGVVGREDDIMSTVLEEYDMITRLLVNFEDKLEQTKREASRLLQENQ